VGRTDLARISTYSYWQSKYFYPAALTTNLFIWQAVIKQLMCAGPAHWYFIITCSMHPLLVGMDLEREILRVLINFLSSAHQ